MLCSVYKSFAVYNRSMNENIFSALQTLPRQVANEDTGAFFKSINGTLQHIMVADVVWLRRFQSTFPKAPYWLTLEGFPHIEKLNQLLFDDLDALSEARRTLDAMILTWVGELDDKQLVGPFEYQDMSHKTHTAPLWFCLSHFFNHQTHHRGQASTMLHQKGIDIGVTDFVRVATLNSNHSPPQ